MTHVTTSTVPDRPTSPLLVSATLHAGGGPLSATPHAFVALLAGLHGGWVRISHSRPLLCPTGIPMVLAEPRRNGGAWLYGEHLRAWSVELSGVYYLGTLIHTGVAHFAGIDLNAHVDRFGVHKTVGQLLGDNFWVLSLLVATPSCRPHSRSSLSGAAWFRFPSRAVSCWPPSSDASPGSTSPQEQCASWGRRSGAGCACKKPSECGFLEKALSLLFAMGLLRLGGVSCSSSRPFPYGSVQHESSSFVRGVFRCERCLF